MTQDTKNIKIFDTTMRDGEQSPGASMNIEEKIKIAQALETLGVDIIEAGFPAASKGDFNAVKEISSIIKKSQVCALSRASQNDIQSAADALKNASQPRIHTFISTSELHMKHKLQLDPDQVYQKVIDSVSFARNLCDDVEWSCEDGTRTNLDFMCKTVEAAIKNGPKGIADLRELFLVNNLGTENTIPKIAAIKIIKKIDWIPNRNPRPDKSFASPKPIASTFLIFLYKIIINQIIR